MKKNSLTTSKDTFEFLSKASALLNSSLDYEAILKQLARLIVPALADFCVVDIIEQDKSATRIATTHKDKAKEPLVRLLQKYVPSQGSPHPLVRVLRNGKPKIIPHMKLDYLKTISVNETHFKIVQKLNPTSYMAVPLVVRKDVIGAITFLRSDSSATYSQDDLIIAEDLAYRAAFAIENAKLYRAAQQEISRRKEIEQELINSKNQLEVIFENAADGITVQDRHGKLIYANDAAARSSGYSTADKMLKATSLKIFDKFELFSEQGDQFSLQRLPGRRALQGEKEPEETILYRNKKTGEKRWSVVKARPILDDKGKVSMAVNIVHDITDRKKIEEDLKESEQKFRLLVDGIKDYSIFLLNDQGYIMSWNEGAERMRGYKAEEVLGKHFSIFYSKEDVKQKTPERVLKMAADLGRYETEGWRIRKDGWNFWAYVITTPIKDNEGNIQGFVQITSDMTERRRMEEVLRFQNALLEAQSEASVEGILVVNKAGKMMSFNGRFVEMWDLPQDLAEHRSDRSTLKHVVHRVLHPREFLNRVNYLYAHIDEEATDEIELKNGKVYERYTSPLKSSEGIYYGRIWFFRDVTAHREDEKRTDYFIGSANHELKNLLTSIKALVQILERKFVKKGDQESAQYLTKMNLQLDKLTRLINDMLDVTRIRSGKFEIHEEVYIFQDMVNDVIESMKHTITSHKIIKKGIVDKYVLGDKTRISQVLINLITNAVKYSPQSSEIIVNVSANNKSVTVSVQDFGIGIPQELKDQIFKPFYRVDTTNSHVIPGAGLGLYFSSEILAQHKGKIWFESTENGTTFYFQLPLNPHSKMNGLKKRNGVKKRNTKKTPLQKSTMI